ncbi:MAG TPA: hypothetical protein VFV29_06325 [Actinomycetota bacterium]|nr:hypothetical protein [Actinomycetota bacterium]
MTDPACATQTVTETVDQVVQPVTGVTDPVVDQVDHVVDQVVDPVTEVTDPVVETVGGVINGVQGTVDPIVDVTEPPSQGHSDVGPDPRTGPGAGHSGNGRSDVGSGSFVGRPIPPPALVGGAFIPSLESVRPISDVRIGASPPTERNGVSFENVVKGLVAFPLALALIVGAFLLAQNRLDRRDPRLALAPVGPDVLDFT